MIFVHSQQLMMGRLHQTYGDIIILYSNNIFSCQHQHLEEKKKEYKTKTIYVSRFKNCTARQCLPLGRKFMKCSIINPALSLFMKHLVIDQHQRAPNFSAFYWSSHGSLVSIG